MDAQRAERFKAPFNTVSERRTWGHRGIVDGGFGRRICACSSEKTTLSKGYRSRFE